MIALLDYGAGNMGSVLKAVKYLGFSAQPVDRPELLQDATKIILPGQGHFGQMMSALGERHLLEPVREMLAAGRPYLGICLGLQALYEGSEEAPEISGMGILPGRVKRFKGVFKVPHVGWSQLEIRHETRLLKNVAPASFVYYCHSYYGPVTEHSAAVTNYGQSFAAAIEMGSVWAVQFHPEKSSEVGLMVLKNFLDL
ncbi:MAG TPA: imidazole glycerol phosphate synthase subunit HisH [Terriglobia bacterium]|nr:imidazole glycerol phosphate synthase subunit HisH [Terriglobia bacterium]